MFSRPIRWILALHGNAVAPFNFAGVSSGRQSCGLRNTSSANFEIENSESYVDSVKNAGILIQIEERSHKIRYISTLLAESVGGHPLIFDSLLEEVSNLVEAPVPILGRFDVSFLELPREILIMVMQKHQKYFPVEDKSNGKLLPVFISVANGNINESIVREGNEAVLKARYEDAKFFYKMDTNKELSEFRNQLSGILFHEKLGTMLDKVTRIEKTVSILSLDLGFKEDTILVVQHAASLAMSDLATSIVTEFTSLSGVMARHYALYHGYSEKIADALFEITLPKYSGDVIPKTDAGITLAVADRLDSLVGLFAAGCQPSSTNDPFGLRRISYGLVQILVENKKNLDLRKALMVAAKVQPIDVTTSDIEAVHQFVTRRLEQLLVDSGMRSEIVRSILLERANWPCIAAQSAMRMNALSEGDLFPKIIEAYSRPTRIIRGKDLGVNSKVNESLFETNEERNLWNTYLTIQTKMHSGKLNFFTRGYKKLMLANLSISYLDSVC